MLTETQNTQTLNLHEMSSLDIVEVMNDEDATISISVKKALPEIAKSVDLIAECLNSGGRLFYVGAGTSGRMGVMDAVECVPTFGTSPEMIQGIMAGGGNATVIAKEDAEDHRDDGYEALREKEITSKDVVIGISASGKTPFVLAALSCARHHKAATIGIACNVPSPLLDQVDVPIGISVGPEILTGSTRLKAGTAQKMVLNMLSTASMVKLGKVFQNLMVDVKPKNQKLIQRAQKIIMQIGEVDFESASKILLESGNDVKVAIVMAKFGYEVEMAKQKLINANGFLNRVLENPKN